MSNKLIDHLARYEIRRQEKRLTECATHGTQPGYTACSCVVKYGAEVAHIIHPESTGTHLGMIRCARPYDAHELSEYNLVCEKCVQVAGLDSVGGKLPIHMREPRPSDITITG